jgi:hypothetical protein
MLPMRGHGLASHLVAGALDAIETLVEKAPNRLLFLKSHTILARNAGREYDKFPIETAEIFLGAAWSNGTQSEGVWRELRGGNSPDCQHCLQFFRPAISTSG